MKKVVDSKNPPSLKNHPSGYVVCKDGFWTYSRYAVRHGGKGWLFTRVKK